MLTVPPYLKNGDTIGIVCPAGYMPAEKMKICIDALHQWGYEVKIGKTAGSQHYYFSGTDEERLNDLQAMLDDKTVNAVLCARGGYGISRIIDLINFKNFIKNPKWVIGYSDVTILHAHLFSQLKIASLHAPMAAAFNNDGAEQKYVQSLQKVLKGEEANYSCKSHSLNRIGITKGKLVGGNLSLLVHLIATKSDFNTRNKILFIEDAGEYIYHIDRMMMQLKRAGRLDKLAGLIIGSFTELKDTVIPFGQSVYELIWDKVKEYDYPVCFNFPVGHTDTNVALKIGVQHKLSVEGNNVMLTEIKGS